MKGLNEFILEECQGKYVEIIISETLNQALTSMYECQ